MPLFLFGSRQATAQGQAPTRWQGAEQAQDESEKPWKVDLQRTARQARDHMPRGAVGAPDLWHGKGVAPGQRGVDEARADQRYIDAFGV
ncbi:hypothetical protein D3C80_1694300 [compost metagenome]